MQNRRQKGGVGEVDDNICRFRHLIDGGVSGVGSSLCIDVQINAGNNLAIGAFGNKLRDEVTHFAAAAT